MNQESKRIFVGNLPAGTSEAEITDKFSSYGIISSIELKSKKDASDNVSHFAFISLNIDYRNLQQCLQDVSNNEWKRGHYVNIQMAKESFLERLKREREEASAKQPSTETNKSIKAEVAKSSNAIKPLPVNNVAKKVFQPFTNSMRTIARKVSSSSSSSSSSESDSDDDNDKIKPSCAEEEELTDFVIKSNKGKKLNGIGLKIESFGKAPIYVSEAKKPKSKDPKRTEADEKRKKSMMEMKKGYQQQKNMIKIALSKTDVKPAMQTNFQSSANSSVKRKSDQTETVVNKRKNVDENMLSLFEEGNDEEGEDTYNFNVNEELSGKKGKKLLELQSKFNYDKRFTLDSRFLEGEEEEEEEGDNERANGGKNKGDDEEEEMTIDEERKKQLKILGDVLGTSMDPTDSGARKDFKPAKSMLRFDPSAPSHSKYELEKVQKENTNKKTKQSKDKAASEEANDGKPEVSQEQFYKVNEDLKQSLQEKQPEGFSLLKTFGRAQGDEDGNEDSGNVENGYKTTAINKLRYDSSDEEAMVEEDAEEAVPQAGTATKPPGSVSWNEDFFFADKDDRFQEGADFLKKLKGGAEGAGFKQLRQNLKEIVRTKVRHNLRKNKPFRKKLGGKKLIKFKKAMKR